MIRYYIGTKTDLKVDRMNLSRKDLRKLTLSPDDVKRQFGSFSRMIADFGKRYVQRVRI